MANYTSNWINTNKSDQRDQALKALEKAKELEKEKLKNNSNDKKHK
jgi:hypothetical protein